MRVVGSGGFGITYEAEDISLGTMVAIKEYYPFDFGDRDATMSVRPKSERHKSTFEKGLSNFLQEARTLARFEHREHRARDARAGGQLHRLHGDALRVRIELRSLAQEPQPSAHARGARLRHGAAARRPADDARGRLPASRYRPRQHHHPGRRHAGPARFRRSAPGRRGNEPLAHRHRQGRLLAARAVFVRRPPAGTVVGHLCTWRHALPRRHRQAARGSHAALRRRPHGRRGAGRQGQVSAELPRGNRCLPQGQAFGATTVGGTSCGRCCSGPSVAAEAKRALGRDKKGCRASRHPREAAPQVEGCAPLAGDRRVGGRAGRVLRRVRIRALECDEGRGPAARLPRCRPRMSKRAGRWRRKRWRPKDASGRRRRRTPASARSRSRRARRRKELADAAEAEARRKAEAEAQEKRRIAAVEEARRKEEAAAEEKVREERRIAALEESRRAEEKRKEDERLRLGGHPRR